MLIYSSTVAVSHCTSQCVNSFAAPNIVCENGTVVNETMDDDTISNCDLLVECFYSNITDALQCAGEANSSMSIISL